MVAVLRWQVGLPTVAHFFSFLLYVLKSQARVDSPVHFDHV